ncbi:MAG: alpha/beta hydrolase [Anaerolineae bacterium]
MPSFYRDNLTFHYTDSGVGFPFIFQHGLGGDVKQTAEVYQPQPGIRMLSLDCRGHGETRPLGDAARLNFDSFADDVIGMMDHLNIPRAVVGGISMGAGISLNIALRHPLRVRGLVLSRPAWLDQPMPDNLLNFVKVAESIRRYGAAEGLQQFKQSEAYQAAVKEAPDVANSLLTHFTHPRAEETYIKLERLPNDAPCRDLAACASITVPTLILGNRHDPPHPYAMAETLASVIPSATLHEIPSKSVNREQHFQDARAYMMEFLSQFGPV